MTKTGIAPTPISTRKTISVTPARKPAGIVSAPSRTRESAPTPAPRPADTAVTSTGANTHASARVAGDFTCMRRAP